MKELALHLLDIAENGITAGADKILIAIEKDSHRQTMKLSVSDNGKGMSKEVLGKVLDPFFTSRTTRKVGMGIPLFRQHAEMTGGKLEIKSVEGEGTLIEAVFYYEHPDIQPLGDIEGCWMLLASANPTIQFDLRVKTEQGLFEINTTEVKEMLEIDHLRGSEISDQLKRLIRNNIQEIGL